MLLEHNISMQKLNLATAVVDLGVALGQRPSPGSCQNSSLDAFKEISVYNGSSGTDACVPLSAQLDFPYVAAPNAATVYRRPKITTCIS